MRQYVRLATALAIILSGVLVVPFAAFPSERIGWQLFGGIYECSPTIQSVGGGDWNDPAMWSPAHVPNNTDIVKIQAGHEVSGPAAASIGGLCNYGTLVSKGNQPLYLEASAFIYNYGAILGSDGSPGADDTCGGPGSNIELRGRPIYNNGVIQAGAGGDGGHCGGIGGSITVLGQNTSNYGTICGGRGGNVLGTAPGPAGDGGYAHIWGKYFEYGGFLVNSGLACGGDGGDGNSAATGLQPGGNGGQLKLISLPYVDLSGGLHYAGLGGLGTGGAANGGDGQVIIEPNVIELTGGDTRVHGGDVVIFGGDDWNLDLSNLGEGAISSSGNISLAVGNGGEVNLQGNSAPVLQANGQVVIASDVILLDPGISLDDVIDAGGIESTPSEILHDVSLAGPGQLVGQPGRPMPIPVTILNGGPMEDIYTLEAFDTVGWISEGLPPVVTIGGLAQGDLTLSVTPPTSAKSQDTDIVFVMAISQSDPNVTARTEILISLEMTKLYLPVILRNP